jgi:hypothetical protein
MEKKTGATLELILLSRLWLHLPALLFGYLFNAFLTHLSRL